MLKFDITAAVVLILFANLFVSCDLFLHNSRLRENVRDSESQIPNFIVVQKSPEEVHAAFAWRPPEDADDDTEEIEKVQLVYRVDDPPTSRLQVLPEDMGGTKSFSRKKKTYAYRWSLDQFKKGDVVWFALYPKVGWNWMAPRYEKVRVEDSISVSAPEIVEPGFRLWVDTSTETVEENPPGLRTMEKTGTYEMYFMIFFEEPPEKRAVYAQLLDNGNTATDLNAGVETLAVHPLWNTRFYDKSVYEWKEGVDTSVGLPTDVEVHQINAMNGGVDVTEVVNRAILYGTNAIYIGSIGANEDLDPSLLVLDIQWQK